MGLYGRRARCGAGEGGVQRRCRKRRHLICASTPRAGARAGHSAGWARAAFVGQARQCLGCRPCQRGPGAGGCVGGLAAVRAHARLSMAAVVQAPPEAAWATEGTGGLADRRRSECGPSPPQGARRCLRGWGLGGAAGSGTLSSAQKHRRRCCILVPVKYSSARATRCQYRAAARCPQVVSEALAARCAACIRAAPLARRVSPQLGAKRAGSLPRRRLCLVLQPNSKAAVHELCRTEQSKSSSCDKYGGGRVRRQRRRVCLAEPVSVAVAAQALRHGTGPATPPNLRAGGIGLRCRGR